MADYRKLLEFLDCTVKMNGIVYRQIVLEGLDIGSLNKNWYHRRNSASNKIDWKTTFCCSFWLHISHRVSFKNYQSVE